MTTAHSGYTDLRQLKIQGRLKETNQLVRLLSGKSRRTGISVIVQLGDEIHSERFDSIELEQEDRDTVSGILTPPIVPNIRYTEQRHRRSD